MYIFCSVLICFDLSTAKKGGSQFSSTEKKAYKRGRDTWQKADIRGHHVAVLCSNEAMGWWPASHLCWYEFWAEFKSVKPSLSSFRFDVRWYSLKIFKVYMYIYGKNHYSISNFANFYNFGHQTGHLNSRQNPAPPGQLQTPNGRSGGSHQSLRGRLKSLHHVGRSQQLVVQKPGRNELNRHVDWCFFSGGLGIHILCTLNGLQVSQGYPADVWSCSCWGQKSSTS